MKMKTASSVGLGVLAIGVIAVGVVQTSKLNDGSQDGLHDSTRLKSQFARAPQSVGSAGHGGTALRVTQMFDREAQLDFEELLEMAKSLVIIDSPDTIQDGVVVPGHRIAFKKYTMALMNPLREALEAYQKTIGIPRQSEAFEAVLTVLYSSQLEVMRNELTRFIAAKGSDYLLAERTLSKLSEIEVRILSLAKFHVLSTQTLDRIGKSHIATDQQYKIESAQLYIQDVHNTIHRENNESLRAAPKLRQLLADVAHVREQEDRVFADVALAELRKKPSDEQELIENELVQA